MATGIFTVHKVTRKTKNLTGARDANIPWYGADIYLLIFVKC
jgi:hypothetical protein